MGGKEGYRKARTDYKLLCMSKREKENEGWIKEVQEDGRGGVEVSNQGKEKRKGGE